MMKQEMDHKTIRERGMLEYRASKSYFTGPEDEFIPWLKNQYYEGMDEIVGSIYGLRFDSKEFRQEIMKADVDMYILAYYIPHPAIKKAWATVASNILDYRERKNKNKKLVEDEVFISEELLFKYEILIMMLFYEFYKRDNYPLYWDIQMRVNDGKIKHDWKFPAGKWDHTYWCEIDESIAKMKIENNNNEKFEIQIERLSDMGKLAEWCIKNLNVKYEYYNKDNE